MKFYLPLSFFLTGLVQASAQQYYRGVQSKIPKHEKRRSRKKVKRARAATNVCAGSKIQIDNFDCVVDGVVQALGQAGADVTVGYKGDLDMTDTPPVTVPFYEIGICPVNVHWHLGAEHRSGGEYDEHGTGPDQLDVNTRLGLRCSHYDEDETMYTKVYEWKHCVDMKVGETYEVHWPHSRAGACGTLNQWQSPFLDGVFCHAEKLDLTALQNDVGVQAQVFTIVNNDDYYFPYLFNGMIVDKELGMGVAITKYTGSTTGTSVNNEVCSGYAPITWQVDRKCHLISASSFDKMCADMAAQRDDMAEDYYAHGSREVVSHDLAANNQVNRQLVMNNFVY